MAISLVFQWEGHGDLPGASVDAPTIDIDEIDEGGNRILVVFYSTENNGGGDYANTEELALDATAPNLLVPTLTLTDESDTVKTLARKSSEYTGYGHSYSNNLSVFYLLESDIAELSGTATFGISYDYTNSTGSTEDPFPRPGYGLEKIHFGVYDNVDQAIPFAPFYGGFEGAVSRSLVQDVPDTDCDADDQWLIFCSGDAQTCTFTVVDPGTTNLHVEWEKLSELNNATTPAVAFESSAVHGRKVAYRDASINEWEDIEVKSSTNTRFGVLSHVLQNDDAVTDNNVPEKVYQYRRRRM